MDQLVNLLFALILTCFFSVGIFMGSRFTFMAGERATSNRSWHWFDTIIAILFWVISSAVFSIPGFLFLGFFYFLGG